MQRLHRPQRLHVNTANLKNHLPTDGPVLHKGHALVATATAVTEFTVHTLEMHTFALLVIVVTFSKEVWSALDICVRKCNISDH